MSIPDYRPFNVVSARSDIQQMYVTTADAAWVKKQAEANKVRMVSVVSALVDHAQTSDEVFKRLIELLKKQDYILAQGGKLPEKVTAEIKLIIEKYEV